MDSCHPIWLGKEVKIKEADDKKKKNWKVKSLGVQGGLKKGREEEWKRHGWMMEVRFKDYDTGV